MISTGSSLIAVAEGVAHNTAAGVSHWSYVYGPLAGLPLLLLVLALCFAEWRQRTNVSTRARERSGLSNGIPTLSVGHFLLQLIPEVGMLVLCALVASAVILRHDNNGSHPKDHVDEQAWKEITNDWPVLMTADTLLALQALFRLVLCISATFRPREMSASPFANEPAAFFLLAGICRVMLLSVSPWEWFHLDGPLGGSIYFGIELVALLLTVYLCRDIFRQDSRRLLLVAAGMLVVCPAALCNRFAIADHGSEYMDVLFSMTQLLEFLAATTFLTRTVALGVESAGPFTSFVHAVLPVQQSLSMYFLLTAFAPPFEVVPEVVGAGRPFEALQIASVAQVGMYLVAAVLHFVFVASADTDTKDDFLQVGLQLAQKEETAFPWFRFDRVVDV